MIRKLITIAYPLLAICFSANAQTSEKYVIDYSNIECPIYFEGQVESIKLSKRKDTLKVVKWERSLLLEKSADTIVIYEYYKGEIENALELRSAYKFWIDQNLIFDRVEDFLNFPELLKLLFMTKKINSEKLYLPVRAYRGEKKEDMVFNGIDSLFNSLQMYSFRGTTFSPEINYFRKVNFPISDIEFYGFVLLQSYESEQYPDIPYGLKLSKEAIERSKYMVNYSKSHKFGFLKNRESTMFDGIIEEEHSIRTSKVRSEYEETKRKSVFVKKKITAKILEKMKG